MDGDTPIFFFFLFPKQLVWERDKWFSPKDCIELLCEVFKIKQKAAKN